MIKHTADHYIERINNNEPFSFSRFGDGELLAMFPSKHNQNCDGSHYLTELIEPLHQIFRNQYDYYHSLLYSTEKEYISKYFPECLPFFDMIDRICPEMPFYDGEVWQSIAFTGRIRDLINSLSIHKPCFVGNSHLQNVNKMHGFSEGYFIEVPSVDCFKESEIILNYIRKYADNGVNMFCFSAGFATKIWIDILFKEYGNTKWFIDFGSMWDPFCGKFSRSGMREKGKEFYQQFTSFKL